MESGNRHTRHFYQITVSGLINQNWSEWFDDLTISSQQISSMKTITRLTGAVDQVALRGILNRLWDLNLTLISVERVQQQPITDKLS